MRRQKIKRQGESGGRWAGGYTGIRKQEEKEDEERVRRRGKVVKRKRNEGCDVWPLIAGCVKREDRRKGPLNTYPKTEVGKGEAEGRERKEEREEEGEEGERKEERGKEREGERGREHEALMTARLNPADPVDQTRICDWNNSLKT